MSTHHIPYETLGNLREEFSRSNLPYKVDVVDWATTNADFRKIILQNCIEIQP
jgi:hypothetical protein